MDTTLASICSMDTTLPFYVYVGQPIKNETFSSAVNLHAKLVKSRTYLACLFGCSHVPFSTCYIIPSFVARQHLKTEQTCMGG